MSINLGSGQNQYSTSTVHSRPPLAATHTLCTLRPVRPQLRQPVGQHHPAGGPGHPRQRGGGGGGPPQALPAGQPQGVHRTGRCAQLLVRLLLSCSVIRL